MKLWREGVASGSRDVASWALESLSLEGRGAAFRHLVSHFEEASHSGRVEALDGARETLAVLRESGVRCALVCDTGLTPGSVVRRHLDRLDVLQHLESLAFSDEVGIPKPHRRIFEAALSPLAVAPGDAVHVGDLRATDVAGARALGMGTVRIRAEHADESDLPDADRVVDSHAALRLALFPGGPGE